MTNRAQNLEAQDGQVATNKLENVKASTAFSNEAMHEMMNNAAGGGNSGSGSDSQNTTQSESRGVAGSIKDLVDRIQNDGSKGGKGSPNQLESHGDSINKKMPNNLDGSIAEKMESIARAGGGMIIKNREVTDEDRKEAKETLGSGMSDLIPEQDRKALTALQGALVDGDLNKLTETLKGLSGDPEKLAKYIKEINGQLDKNETLGGIDLSQDAQGNVLVYNEKGGTALQINPKTGEASLRAVERQADGSVLLKPGEVLGRTAAEVARDLGDSLTRSLTMDFGKIIIGKDGPGKPWPPKDINPIRPLPFEVPLPNQAK